MAQRLRAAGFVRVQNLEGSIFPGANDHRALVHETASVARVHPYNAFWGRLLDDDVRAPLRRDGNFSESGALLRKITQHHVGAARHELILRSNLGKEFLPIRNPVFFHDQVNMIVTAPRSEQGALIHKERPIRFTRRTWFRSWVLI
jgi:hypothetical protein